MQAREAATKLEVEALLKKQSHIELKIFQSNDGPNSNSNFTNTNPEAE